MLWYVKRVVQDINHTYVDIMKTTQPALRPYLETIENRCRSLDKESLIELILSLAKQVDTEKRNDFLRTFHSSLPNREQQKTELPEILVTDLLAEIKELHQEIEARIESIEDGTYWDNPDEDWEDSDYTDEEPDMLNEDQQEALAEYFSKADHCFIQGDKKKAKDIYGALFTLMSEAEEYGYYLPDIKVDLREAGSRFARCVYQLSPENERLDTLLEIMTEDLLSVPPLLVDIIDAETGDLEDFDSFLPSWQTALAEYDFRIKRIAELLLEATFMHSGAAAAGELARNWGKEQPLGYLYWLQELEREENWEALRDISNEALNLLPFGDAREKAANYLIKAGKQLAEDTIILTGYREQFKSGPSNSMLLDLITEARRQQLRKEELERVCTFLSETDRTFTKKTLLIKSLLMAGEIDRAFALCKQDKAVGWSSSDGTGLLYGAVLYILSGSNDNCTQIHDLLKYYTNPDVIFLNGYNCRPAVPETTDVNEILQGLQNIDTSSLDLEHYRKWVWDIGQKRVNHIVSNTHRSAYERAAMTLCSLAEFIAIQGDKDKAQALLREYCRVRYNRHPAFRREMREVVGKSRILCGMVGGL